jgi:glycosyltransferase involved in cell wall biosynthesis
MSNTKLVILTPGFPKDEADSTCLPFIQQFVLAYSKLYSPQSLVVISFQYPFQSHTYFWNSIAVISIGGKNKGKLYRRITWQKVNEQLKQLKNNHPILGLLSFFHDECALVGSKFAHRNKLKHYSWLQGQDAKKENKYVSKIQAKAESIIANSIFLQAEFYRNHNVKPKYVIDNGVNEAVFPTLNSGKRNIDVFGAGSLIPLKNYRLFIEVIGEIKKQFPFLNTVIAGQGEEFNGLNARIKELGLENTISLLGLKSHSEVLALMNDSKVFLHTSHYEGSGSVLSEALYSGCQVVSTVNSSNINFEEFNLILEKEKIIERISAILSQTTITHERVLFNSLENSAQQLAALFNQ